MTKCKSLKRALIEVNSLLKKASIKVHSFQSSSFERYADIVYSRPYIFILLSVLLIGFFSYGFLSYDEIENEIDLWIPKDSESLKDNDSIDRVYKIFYVSQMAYAIGKDEGASLLTKEVFEELISFEQSLWENFDVEGLKYKDICFSLEEGTTNETSCETKDYPFMFFLNSDASFDRSSLSSDFDLLQKINSGKGTTDFYPQGSSLYISIEDMFGTTTPQQITTQDDGSNNIQDAKAIRWTYYISDNFSDSMIDKFYEELEDLMKDFNKSSQHVNIYPLSDSLRRREYLETINEDTRHIIFALVCLMSYPFYVVGQLNTYQSRLFVGAVGLLSVMFAYVEAVALATYLEVHGNPLINSIPFLLLGIGLDDMYVLLLCLSQAPPELEGKEKFKYMMRNAGVSITITSLANVCAFSIGAVTAVPAVRNYVLHLAFGMFFEYGNQITFFLGFLAYDIRRSEKEKGDCWGLIFCKPDSSFCCKGKCTLDENGNPQTPVSQIIIENYYGKFLMNKVVKVVVLGFFLCLTAINIYGLLRLEVDFNMDWLIEEEHYIYNAFQVRENYFDTNIEADLFFTINANFEDEEVQRQISDLENLIDSCDGCEKKWIEEGSTKSWYSAYKDWIRRGNCAIGSNLILLENDFVPSTYFYECLSVWVSSDEGSLFYNKLAWEDSILVGAAIETSLIIPKDSIDVISAVEDTRRIAAEGPGNTFPLSTTYFWGDHFSVFTFETILGLGCSLGIVLIVLLIAFANIVGALLAFSTITLTVVGQLSLLYFWDEKMNSVVVTYTIMAIGVSVDYSSHIIHTYSNKKESDKNTRAIKTLGSIGTSIFNGFMSTFLKIVALSLSTHFPFVLSFKSWLGILVYSVIHALVLLPVLLSFLNLSHDSVEHSDQSKVVTVFCERPDINNDNLNES